MGDPNSRDSADSELIPHVNVYLAHSGFKCPDCGTRNYITHEGVFTLTLEDTLTVPVKCRKCDLDVELVLGFVTVKINHMQSEHGQSDRHYQA